MTAILVVLAITALIVLLVIGVGCWLFCDFESEIEREQAKAEAAINEEHQAARRAMNDAAGQSWRNLSE